jgi:hypothetical protein
MEAFEVTERNARRQAGRIGGTPRRRTTGYQLRRNTLAAERNMPLNLRDNGTIAEDTLRRVQQSPDLEESRLHAR